MKDIKVDDYIRIINLYVSRIEAEKSVLLAEYKKAGKFTYQDKERFIKLNNLSVETQKKYVDIEFLNHLMNTTDSINKARSRKVKWQKGRKVALLLKAEENIKNTIEVYGYFLTNLFKDNGIYNFKINELSEFKKRIMDNKEENHAELLFFIAFYERLNNFYQILLKSGRDYVTYAYNPDFEELVFENLLGQISSELLVITKQLLHSFQNSLSNLQQNFTENKDMEDYSKELFEAWENSLNGNLDNQPRK